jgi:hypothetical protein
MRKMVVVFVDPFCKHFRLLSTDSTPHTNGYYIPFEGSIHDFVAEITLCKLAKFASPMGFRVIHPDRALEPTEILAALESVAKRCSSYMDNLIGGYEESLLLSMILLLEKQYRTAVAAFVSAVESSPFDNHFEDSIGEINSLTQKHVWRFDFPDANGTMQLNVRGLGSGQVITWNDVVASCLDDQCLTGKVRRKMIDANILYYQIQWIFKQLSYAAKWSNKPKYLLCEDTYVLGRDHRYTRGWYESDDCDAIFPETMRCPPKLLTVWTEYKSHSDTD